MCDMTDVVEHRRLRCFLCLLVSLGYLSTPVHGHADSAQHTPSQHADIGRADGAESPAKEAPFLRSDLAIEQDSELAKEGRPLRRLQQDEEGSECSLSQTQIRTYLNAEERIWTLHEEAFQDIENDLQVIVDCTEAGDTLFLDVPQLQPSRQVLLRRDITISATTNSTELDGGVFPLATQKTVINCPEGNEGAFLLQAPSVSLANLEFTACGWNASETPPAIIRTQECESDEILRDDTVETPSLESSSGIERDPERIIDMISLQPSLGRLS